ncbi:MAG: ABC exporter membrane fusion protein [Cyanobacteriota bacterium]|nr:ABC exporter membrane fusion protein [Cyanobacteriota bacterium]
MNYRGMALIVAGLLVSGSLGLYGWTRYGATQAQETQASPPPAPPPSVVGALGRLEPQGQVIEIGGPTGERIAELLVEEGQVVKTGAELARLESYEERLAERDYAASQLSEAQARLEAETRYAQAQIAEARSRLQQIDQPQSLQVEAQKARIRQLEAELADAQNNQQRFQALFADGVISQQELDSRRLQVRQKEEELSSAQATLNQLQTSRAGDLENWQAQMQSAQANLVRTQNQIQILSLSRNLELATTRLERTVIRAPRDGQILRILKYPGEAIDNSGSILQMGNTQQMVVVAEVYETDVNKIKLGQQAVITSNAFDQALRGTVQEIGLLINKKDVLNTDPAADVDARVVEVKIMLEPESSQISAGLTNLQVDVAIDL